MQSPKRESGIAGTCQHPKGQCTSQYVSNRQNIQDSRPERNDLVQISVLVNKLMLFNIAGSILLISHSKAFVSFNPAKSCQNDVEALPFQLTSFPRPQSSTSKTQWRCLEDKIMIRVEFINSQNDMHHSSLHPRSTKSVSRVYCGQGICVLPLGPRPDSTFSKKI